MYLVIPLQVLGVVALCTDSLSADDFLPAMASVLPRAALRRLASDVISVTNFSWREDFEDMWLFHFVASIGLMAQLASASPASASQSAAAAAAAAADAAPSARDAGRPILLLPPRGDPGRSRSGGILARPQSERCLCSGRGPRPRRRARPRGQGGRRRARGSRGAGLTYCSRGVRVSPPL